MDAITQEKEVKKETTKARVRIAFVKEAARRGITISPNDINYQLFIAMENEFEEFLEKLETLYVSFEHEAIRMFVSFALDRFK